MESVIKPCLIKIFENFDRLKILQSKYTHSLNKGSMGSSQSLKIQMLNMKGKILHQMKILSGRVKGEIIEVELLTDGVENKGIFVNLSNEDIRDIYKLVSKSTGKEIEIVKINRRPTYILFKS